MTAMKVLAFTGALFGVLGCKSKSEQAEPAKTEPAVKDTAPEGSAAPTPPAGSAAAQTPSTPGGESKAPYGTCNVTATGAIDFVSSAENLPGAVITDHWHTAEAKAEIEKIKADAAKRGETFRMPEQPLSITCHDVPRGLHIRFAPTLSGIADIRPAPQDFPIVQIPEDKPGVMRAEVTMRDGGITVKGGALHVTKFEQGDLAATFELDIETFDEPPKKAKLAGSFNYRCAEPARCGMK